MRKLASKSVLSVAGLALSLAAAAQGQAAEAPAPPAGASAQVLAGAALYQQNCAVCHGAMGRDATVFPRPIWGPGHDLRKFGNAKGLFEYLQMLMPFDNPAKVDDAGKTAIAAYILVRNGNLKPADSLPPGGNETAVK